MGPMKGLCGTGEPWGGGAPPGLPGGGPRGRTPRGGGLESGGAGDLTPGGGKGILSAVGPGGIGMSSVPAASFPDITDDALFLAPCGPPPGGTAILLRSISLLFSLLSTLFDTDVSFAFNLLVVSDVLLSFE